MDQQAILLAGFGILVAGALAAWLVGDRHPSLLRHGGFVAILAAGACFGIVSVVVLRTGVALGPLTVWQPSFVHASLSIRVDALEQGAPPVTTWPTSPTIYRGYVAPTAKLLSMA